MKRTIMGGLLAVGALLGGLALTSTSASAVVIDNEQPGTEVCYAQVPYTVYQFSKTTSTPTFVLEYEFKKEDQKTQYEVDKYTRERSRTAAIWQNFSPNKDQGPFEGPPSWPTDPRGTWQHQNKPIPPGQAGPDGVYQNGTGNGSWFYRAAAGAWSAWSAPTRWQPTGSHLAWVDVVPAANWQEHGNSYTDTYQRDWTVYPTGATRQVGTGTFTKDWFTSNPGAPWVATGNERSTLPGEPIVTVVFYNDGDVGPDNLAVKGVRANWTTNQNLGHSWKQLDDTDTFFKDGDRIPCSDKPDDYSTTRETSAPCTVVGQTTTKVTVYTQDWTYKLNDGSEWVAVKDGDEHVATYVRNLTVEEKAGCPTPPPTRPRRRSSRGRRSCRPRPRPHPPLSPLRLLQLRRQRRRSCRALVLRRGSLHSWPWRPWPAVPASCG